MLKIEFKSESKIELETEQKIELKTESKIELKAETTIELKTDTKIEFLKNINPYQNMSYLKITDPRKRDLIISEFLKTKKYVSEQQLKERLGRTGSIFCINSTIQTNYRYT